jgi:hypothetical protein
MINNPNLNKDIETLLNGEQSEILVPDLEMLTAIEPALTLRDTIRQAFQDYGVEIEFSGKGAYERGVVIDIDAEFMLQRGLDPDALRFGQTVVRVKA